MAYMRNIQASLGTLAKGDALEFGASGVITPADIVGAGVGQLSHANGYVIVPALGAHVALALVSFAWFYDFAGAAYGGGGNLSVTYGVGGQALTGIVSAANSIGAAVDKLGILYPLSAAGIVMQENNSINLLTVTPFTQPGNATGVLRYSCVYMAFKSGFLP
jgi:hypothetical protein